MKPAPVGVGRSAGIALGEDGERGCVVARGLGAARALEGPEILRQRKRRDARDEAEGHGAGAAFGQDERFGGRARAIFGGVERGILAAIEGREGGVSERLERERAFLADGLARRGGSFLELARRIPHAGEQQGNGFGR